jgi:hypothetical protein
VKVTAVESTTLTTIGYDERRLLLRLKFRSCAVYDYFGVPAEVHEALLSGPSIGACFNELVRGRFPYRQVGGSNAESGGKGER